MNIDSDYFDCHELSENDIYVDCIPTEEKRLLKFIECIQTAIQNTFIKRFKITNNISFRIYMKTYTVHLNDVLLKHISLKNKDIINTI